MYCLRSAYYIRLRYRLIMAQEFTSNLDDLIVRFKAVGQQAQQLDVSQALLAGVNAAAGDMDHRIFNKGLDAEGVSLGLYVGSRRKPISKKAAKVKKKSNIELVAGQNNFTPYELKRLESGRQVLYKDLEFEGTLRRGIVVVEETPTRVVCAIPSSKLQLIAAGQEEQVGAIRGGGPAPIFALSASEQETLIFNTTEILNQLYDRLFTIE